MDLRMTAMPAPYADPDAPRFESEEERWNAVARRDKQADGRFYYSVRTTGVYCRPSCAARLPRRENVRFYLSPREAEEAGFRACKRCRPNGPPPEKKRVQAIEGACRLIKESEEFPGLESLAHAAGMSRFHFHRTFKSVTGVTPRAFAAAERARRVRKELQRSKTVTEAIYGAGFNSNGRFYAASSEMLGMTPTRFRSGGKGVEIRFAFGESSLGLVLVAVSEKGVCAIFFGEDPEALRRDLERRFPQATLKGGDEDFAALVAKVVAFVEAPRRGLDLPLDLQGTAFERRVWQALREIPAGSTTSYRAIAERIGAPKAARAVARACAANRIAVAVPCHRVTRSDGSLSGYRWGVERKRLLIARESGG
jgi:AraC family transcriptional regulator, regulatory protein of adaptative response / methylated-DNA-[protein]-cysteine methyltransferase